MKKFYIRVEKVVEDWYTAETEDEAYDLAEKDFEQAQVECFIMDEEDV